MNLKQQLDNDVIVSMKSKDSFKTKLLRNLLSKIKQIEVDTQQTINEEQILTVLQKQIKQRKESCQIFKDNNRKDLADIEEQELIILESYLPKQMDEETLTLIVKSTIDSLEATSMKDMGRVMTAIKQDTAGKADPSKVSSLVKEYLK